MYTMIPPTSQIWLVTNAELASFALKGRQWSIQYAIPTRYIAVEISILGLLSVIDCSNNHPANDPDMCYD